MRFSLFMVVQRSLNTFIECVVADGCDGVGDGYRGQPAAALECPVADGGDGVGDDKIFYLCAIQKQMMCTG